MLEVYRSKRARQACDTGWKPAELNIHRQREQTPLTLVKHKSQGLGELALSFLIKCKNCIDQKEQAKLAIQAGNQQYKETDRSRIREQTPLNKL